MAQQRYQERALVIAAVIVMLAYMAALSSLLHWVTELIAEVTRGMLAQLIR